MKVLKKKLKINFPRKRFEREEKAWEKSSARTRKKNIITTY